MEDFYKELTDKLPKNILDTITNYLEKGLRPDSFISACIANDLMAAVAHHEDEYFRHLHDICMYLHWCIAGGGIVYGSYEVMARHMNKFK